MQYTWQLALVLVPVYFIKHSVSCYIYYIHTYKGFLRYDAYWLPRAKALGNNYKAIKLTLSATYSTDSCEIS